MANNIISAVFSSSNITYTKPAYQYDYGMILKFSGIELPQAYEVHFSNTEFCGESISQIGDESGVTIPDEMFLSGAPIYAWTYLHTGLDDGETVYKTVISINKRAQPSDIEPTPVQQDVITQAIAALNTAVEQTAQDVVDATAAKDAAELAQGKAEDAQTAAETAQDKAEDAQSSAEGFAGDALQSASDAQGYASDAHGYAQDAEQAAGAVLGLTADATVDANVGTPSVEVNVSTVSDHKNMSFSFHNLKGVPGDPGEPGDDGFSPVVSVSEITGGHEVAVTDKNGTQTFDVMDGTDGQDGISPTITVTEISGGHSVEVVDAQGTQTFDVMDGEVSEEELETALIDKADVITSSASGEIVTIADGGNNLPVVDLKVSLLPVQSGSGDPSPTNVRPISGWTGVEVTRTKKNVVSKVVNCYFYANAVHPIMDYLSESAVFYAIKGTTYVRSSDPMPTRSSIALADSSEITASTNLSNAHTMNPEGKTTWVAEWTGWTVWYFYPKHSVSVEETAQIEVGSTATAYEPYNGNTYPIDWSAIAGTVYECTIHPDTGVLSVDGVLDVITKDSELTDRGNGIFNYATQNNFLKQRYSSAEKFFCDTLPIAFVDSATSAENGKLSFYNAVTTVQYSSNVYICPDNTTITTIEQVRTWLETYPIAFIYPLYEPIEYQLTPVQISTLIGDNSFWSNGNGTLDLEYRCDTKLYIEQLTKPSEDDMTANANIASGKFFMVGNRLMLSTTAIAQGEQIVVGTNCSEVSLADALNQINA